MYTHFTLNQHGPSVFSDDVSLGGMKIFVGKQHALTRTCHTYV